MIQGFVKLDSTRFYRDIWPLIKADVDPIESNWKEVSTCKKAGIPAPTLLIYWGYKDDSTGEKTVMAITRSEGTSPDEHWAAPHLMLEAY